MSENALVKVQRATLMAWFGLILQTLIAAVWFIAALRANSDLFEAMARLTTLGIPVWLALILIFVQQRRVFHEGREAQELLEAKKRGGDAALFEVDQEEFQIEKSKLTFLQRYFIPGIAIFLALYVGLGHFLGWGWEIGHAFEPGTFTRTQHPFVMMWFAGGLAFISFLFGRAAVGLGRIPGLELIRAGAGFMIGSALLSALVLVALGLSTRQDWAEPMAGVIIRLVLLLIGLEIAANFIADFYRPRLAGVVQRPAFDSRILGLFSEPGGVAKSLAEAINYQFGFEVSKTWFYQLLQSTLLPLLIVTAVLILLLTSVMVVDADQVAVVERWGRRLEEGGKTKLYSPGVHFKLPWPVDVSYRLPVKQIQGFVIGEDPSSNQGQSLTEAILWSNEHTQKETYIITASPREDGDLAGSAGNLSDSEDRPEKSVAVNLVRVSMPLEFRVRDIGEYLYRYDHPEEMLESIAWRKLYDLAAGIDVESIMGPEREAFNRRLASEIQSEADRLGLGVEVVFCGLASAHPGSEGGVAQEYQNVIAAEGQKAQRVSSARNEAEVKLIRMAGSVDRARQLDTAIQEMEALAGRPDGEKSDRYAELKELIDDLMLGHPDKGISPIRGRVSKMIDDARRKAEDRISFAETRAKTFAGEVAAYLASPALYRARKQLEIYERLDDVRKCLIVGDSSSLILEYNGEEVPAISLGES